MNLEKTYKGFQEQELAEWLQENIRDYKAKKGLVWNNKDCKKKFEDMIKKNKHLFPELKGILY